MTTVWAFLTPTASFCGAVGFVLVASRFFLRCMATACAPAQRATGMPARCGNAACWRWGVNWGEAEWNLWMWDVRGFSGWGLVRQKNEEKRAAQSARNAEIVAAFEQRGS